MGLISTPFSRILESLVLPDIPVFLLRLVHEAIQQDPTLSESLPYDKMENQVKLFFHYLEKNLTRYQLIL